jgi:hypothetical protein
MLGSATTLPDQLTASITATHDTLLRTTGKSANKSVDDFVSDQSFLGPVLVSCGLADGIGGLRTLLPELAYGGWPAEGARAAVGIRSLSKMLGAATYLALVERGEGGLALDSRLGSIVPECASTRLASTTAVEAMSMRTRLDNRLSAAWGASEGMDDHASFPPECDSLGLSALRCVAEVVCPRYGDAEPEDVSAGVVGCEDRKPQCRAWARYGECEANPNFMLTECEAACGACERGASQTAAQVGGRAWWTVATDSCADQHPDCQGWASQEQCASNEGFVRLLTSNLGTGRPSRLPSSAQRCAAHPRGGRRWPRSAALRAGCATRARLPAGCKCRPPRPPWPQQLASGWPNDERTFRGPFEDLSRTFHLRRPGTARGGSS